MGLSLITELPAWGILLCLAAGILYATLLYRKDPVTAQVSLTGRKILFVLRALLISMLAFLLLGPMLRTIVREVEKPIIILAIDASESILNTKDSVAVRDEMRNAAITLGKNLGKDYDLRTYSFGDHARENSDWNFKDKATDFNQLYDLIDVNYTNRNVGAVILASDGLYNQGSSPVYGPQRVKAPVYTIALGDTTERKDLVLAKVNSNRIAFLGNNFPLEVIIDAHQCGGSVATLRISEDSTEVFTRVISLSGNRFHTTVTAFLEAKKKGIHHYKIAISVLEGEVTAANNVKDVFIEVAENKQKILLLSNAPHPDIAAIKNSIEVSPNYEVTVSDPAQWQGRASAFNLLILHNLPSASQNIEAVLKQFNDAGVAVWFILGPSTNINALNNLSEGINIQAQTPVKVNEMLPVAVQQFSLFSISTGLQEAINNWPPLSGPFGVYTVNGNIYPLLNQKIGSVLTNQPLLFFNEKDKHKSALLAGEGLWKWNLTDFNQSGTHDHFNELVSKVVQYLIVRENTSPFRVFIHNPVNENETVIIDAELYNQADQLVNDPEAKISITNDQGKIFPYTFSRNGKAYTLNAGQFSVGRYKYKAEVKLGDQLYRQEGEFSVNALQVETSSTVADHQVLYALSNRTGGFMLKPSQVNALADSIRKREDVKPVSYAHKKLIDLVSMPWFLTILILLLSVEWFIRKRSGGY